MRRNLYCYGYIFVITNSINGKRFVGKSICSLNQTVKRILRNIKNPTTSEYKTELGEDIRKYGPENFQIEILEELYLKGDESILNSRIVYYRKKYDTVMNGYNDSYTNSAMTKPKDQISKYSIVNEERKNKIISMFLSGWPLKDIRKELSMSFYTIENVLSEACLIPYSVAYLNSQQIVCTENYSYVNQFNGINEAAKNMYGNTYYRNNIKNLINYHSNFNGYRYDAVDTNKTPKNCPLIFIKRREI